MKEITASGKLDFKTAAMGSVNTTSPMLSVRLISIRCGIFFK